MIQRIQTVYLLAVTALSIICLCLPIGAFADDNNAIYDVYNLCITDGKGMVNYSIWALFALLLLVAIVSFVTIFLFKKRMLQIRFTIFSSILLIGYYATLLVFVYLLHSLHTFTPSWTLCIPFICIILNWLAIRGIGKDEMLVKAYDRLR